MRTVSVHWTFGVKSPVHRKISEMSAPGQRRRERHQQDAPVVAEARLARAGWSPWKQRKVLMPSVALVTSAVSLEHLRGYSP